MVDKDRKENLVVSVSFIKRHATSKTSLWARKEGEVLLSRIDVDPEDKLG
jgi:hypothetical protein